MKRTLKILLLAVLASLLAVQAVCAEGKLVFERGKQVVLFEQDGVKLTLNGEVQDDGGCPCSFPACWKTRADTVFPCSTVARATAGR